MTRNQLYAIFERTQAIYDEESVIRDVRAHSSESRILMEKLFFFFSFFLVILGLHDTFRNVTPRINEKVLYCYLPTCQSPTYTAKNKGFHEVF